MGLCGGFAGGSDGKESAFNTEDLGSIPGSEITPREGNGSLSLKAGFATCGEWRLLSYCGVQALEYTHFSSCGTWA